ncbi:hypothetical protein GCM10010172_47010 [Paractinoplanes ferrugineus]|uniref:Peptidoglycan-binding protein n=1 Tax=Paractinoplanes ferrugineus TaxID=113564 RepID=A0A919IWP4_9ACTN|nr:hypothetical protein [Actinoplanes ferrugineus]GIE10285.1 hypothetical protein Afe05nite_21250 [Actinoplanes ferrugineus]
MNEENIGKLKHEQGNIHAATGVWGTDELAGGCAAAAAIPGFAGDSGTVHDIAGNIGRTHEIATKAWESIRAVGYDGGGIGASWVGDAHVAAQDAVRALMTDIDSLTDAMRTMPGRLRDYASALEQHTPADNGAVDELTDVAEQASRMTALGFLPDFADYDGQKMAELQFRGAQAVDARVTAHEQIRDRGRDLASVLRDNAGLARGRRLRDSPMSALDEIVVAEAGNNPLFQGNGVLTLAQEERAAAAMSGLGDADRQRMMGLLGSSQSPEQRAYLMKMLAAGYSVDDVAKFNGMIAAHGADPRWLAEHLTPFTMDSDRRTGADGKQWNTFDGAQWTQGQYPTCVASSTVAARAAVDPLYALQLTTGGHPGDPALDNPDAFAQRLREQQEQVYDDGRGWTQKLPVIGSDGMSNDQSETIADEQIAPRTGASYRNVDMGGSDARYDRLPQIEQAVDEGYPVPVSTRGDEGGHQMMIVGHQGDQLQIYNPWGYTYWVSEDAFMAGDISNGTEGLPGKPMSVRLPTEVK